MFDLALARRLSRPGPRYTSYPTALQFHDGVDAEAYTLALAGAAVSGRPLSLYVHIPFCAKLCNYCGCHMQVTHRPEKVARYAYALEQEAHLLSSRLGAGREVVQMHWGGGTPNSLSPEQIERLAERLRQRFAFAARAEMSLEGDPRTLTREHLAAAARAGFNRLSLGVQSLDPMVQQAIGRVQPLETVARVVTDARAEGLHEISFDLLYGLPFQTPERFAATLEGALDLQPDRLSVFGYAHVPWMKKHQQLLPEDELPGATDRLALFALAYDRLTAAGYVPVGMDHFARPDDPLVVAMRHGTLHRTFQGYTTHAGTDLVGLGVSSVSMLDRLYAQNAKGLKAYYDALETGTLPIERGVALTGEDALRRHVIHELMCRFGLEKGRVGAAFEIDFDTHFADALDQLAELEALGVVSLGPERIVVLERGRPFVRNVAMAFDGYLPQTPVSTGRYSQTV